MNKLLIVDDHRIFTDGIRFLIEHTTDLKVAGVLHSGKEVLPFLGDNPVDIILLDIDLPDIPGFEVAKLVKKSHSEIRIVALSMLDDIGSMERMFQVGAKGYCIKSDGREEVFRAIRQIREGGTYWPKSYLKFLEGQTDKISEIRLTDREREIIALICRGSTSSAIAEKLFISSRTVETHRKNIYRKLNVHTNVELAQYARKHLI
ncbi:LuxR C-terminal-related transcriptional regulator [Dyadobacter arcticus]|uniref:DNA-binding NarL/FixJ family response regulator n=1 Tax=Dyadobacter arcticus TaxID=1078754 RepID=A0ABX0ULC2_9BACT|nr:response regulator transcription factor [Dyadobacter arcticus]NIJ53808.1 DNA-binding NarL/FixJ family response regulator [Dyadobacter arcticus]